MGCLVDLPFLPSYPEGFRETLGVCNASGARLEPGAGAHSPLSTLNSRLQEKNISFQSSSSHCLLYPDNPESLQGHFHVATHCIMAQVLAHQDQGVWGTPFPGSPDGQPGATAHKHTSACQHRPNGRALLLSLWGYKTMQIKYRYMLRNFALLTSWNLAICPTKFHTDLAEIGSGTKSSFPRWFFPRKIVGCQVKSINLHADMIKRRVLAWCAQVWKCPICSCLAFISALLHFWPVRYMTGESFRRICT